MGIVKINKKENNFAQIDKKALTDNRLSFKAKGILAYLLSKPDQWKTRISDIANHSPKESNDAVRTGLKELSNYGYASLVSDFDENHKLVGKSYQIYEDPNDNPRHRDNTNVGKSRHGENPDVGETPMTINKDDHINKEDFSNKSDIDINRSNGFDQQKLDDLGIMPEDHDAYKKMNQQEKKIYSWLKEVIDYFNEVADSKERVTKNKAKHFVKVFNHEEMTVEGAKAIIDYKKHELDYGPLDEIYFSTKHIFRLNKLDDHLSAARNHWKKKNKQKENTSQDRSHCPNLPQHIQPKDKGIINKFKNLYGWDSDSEFEYSWRRGLVEEKVMDKETVMHYT